MNKLGKIIVVVAIIGVVGYAATSFAGWGGGGNCWGQGSGYDQPKSAAPGVQGNLSDEDIDRLNEQREAFFEETRELRENLYQKKMDLRSAMAEPDPDVENALALQREISELEGQMDQKRLAHRLKMQKENPDYFAGRGFGKGRGYGMGPGGMGRGFQGRGGCWR